MVIYTNRSKTLETIGALICIYEANRLVETESFNLGPFLEIADAESIAASTAIKLAYKRVARKEA